MLDDLGALESSIVTQGMQIVPGVFPLGWGLSRYPFFWLRSEWRVLRAAMMFSLMSAFNLGFRQLDFGRWIRMLMVRPYDIKPVGWVRTVSGVQSLVTVYLVALWVLTYFGRPFGLAQRGHDHRYRPRRPPPLADYRAFTLSAFCQTGDRSVRLDKDALADRYGWDVLLEDIRRRLKCRQCGHRSKRLILGYHQAAVPDPARANRELTG